MRVQRILVVDDDPQIRRVMRTALTGEGFEVADARTGEDGLERLRGERFDLVLLDVNMPGIGGMETCRLMRATSEIAIVMLTVRDSEADKIGALDAGADDYVTKPFSTPELLARIRAALRRVPGGTESSMGTVTLPDLEINLSARRVVVHGNHVRLTPKEFDLLQYFLSNVNVPLSHGRLLQAVWGPDYGSEVEYLRVFVNQLRKKIEPNPSKPKYILTEPWHGYRFQMPADA
ncbi:MAG TPA: response regulator transcription factor [Verrucomicrobiae bacterium]|nr:response regulator transcription factor [Verrucomicrobiae bacterium]